MTPTATRPRSVVGSIPDELKALPRWVVFQITRGPGGKTKKLPLIAGKPGKHLAEADNPATWRSFAEAHADSEARGLYLAFVFDRDIPYFFIDADEVIDADEMIRPDIVRLGEELATYTEFSASGRGLHIIGEGAFPERCQRPVVPDGCKAIELYPLRGARFCIVTGDVLDGLETIENRADVLTALFPPRAARPVNGSAESAGYRGAAGTLGDDEADAIVAWAAPLWRDGRRHHMALHLSGYLSKAGVSRNQAATLIERCASDDSDPGAKLTACHDTYDDLETGADVSGWHGLKDVCGISEDDLAPLKTILDAFWQRHNTGGATLIAPGRHTRLLTAQSGDKTSEGDRWPAPPPEVYHGWFGGYLEMVSETTEAPDQFHLAAALTIVGAYAGRNVHVRHASIRTYPNLYTVLVGLSSESKKDTAIARAWEMAVDPPWSRTRTASPYAERNSVASAESFIKGLSQTSNVIVRMSEFSEILANARRKGTTTILTMLMKAWDTPNQLSNDSITNPATAVNPYVSILAGTQPDVLAGDLIGTDITSGFANRVLFVPGSGKARMPRPPEVDERGLHEHWLIVKRNLQTYGIDQRLEITWDARAMELWDHFYMMPRGESAIERTMSQRHQNMVLKIALIYALTDGAKTITFDHLEHAIAFIDWEWACVKRLIAGWATSNDNRLADRILQVLKATGPIKRRILQKKTSDPKWSPNDFARLVRSMAENGTLGINEDGLIGIKDD